MAADPRRDRGLRDGHRTTTRGLSALLFTGLMARGDLASAAWVDSLPTHDRREDASPTRLATPLPSRSNDYGPGALAFALSGRANPPLREALAREMQLPASLAALASSARARGVNARPLHYADTVASLASLQAPFVVHLRREHYVALVSSNASRVAFYDPATRRIETMPAEAFSAEWSGYGLELRFGVHRRSEAHPNDPSRGTEAPSP